MQVLAAPGAATSHPDIPFPTYSCRLFPEFRVTSFSVRRKQTPVPRLCRYIKKKNLLHFVPSGRSIQQVK